MPAKSTTPAPSVLSDESVTILATYADAEVAAIAAGARADLSRVPAMLAVNALTSTTPAKSIAADIATRFGDHPGAAFLPTAPNRVPPFAMTGVMLAAWADESADLGHYVDQYRRTVNVDAARVQSVIEFLCNKSRTKQAREIVSSDATVLSRWMALVALFDARKMELDTPKPKTQDVPPPADDVDPPAPPAGDVVNIADALLTAAAAIEAFIGAGGVIDETTTDALEAWGMLSAQLDTMVDTYSALSPE